MDDFLHLERSVLTVFFLHRILDKVPNGPMFIGFCFLVRAMDAIGFAAAMTASFSILAKAFPNNIATVMVSSKSDVTAEFPQYNEFAIGSLKPGG